MKEIIVAEAVVGRLFRMRHHLEHGLKCRYDCKAWIAALRKMKVAA